MHASLFDRTTGERRAVVRPRHRDDPAAAPPEPEIVGLAALRRELTAIGSADSTVLVTGETGTGKGLVARRIHALSERSRRPFLQVDCTALSPALFESELFGHERGAFTGALHTQPGRFERAAGGTIFLDEIGHLAPPLQAKLLRVLQDREYERVGGCETLRMSARVIAATSRDLPEAVASGSFRPDLYFRLRVLFVEVPPLRARGGDVRALADAAIARVCAQLGVDPPPVDPGFYTRLLSHPWPGNVRELMNVIECALVRERPLRLDAGILEDLLVPPPPHVPPQAPEGGSTQRTAARAAGPPAAEAERARIAQVLQETGGNVSRAARRLGVARSTLRYRISKLGLGATIPRD